MILQVWLKHDLRLDDHPGFVQAADSAQFVLPFFCLAPELYVHLLRTPNGIKGRTACSHIYILTSLVPGLPIRMLWWHPSLHPRMQYTALPSRIAGKPGGCEAQPARARQ